MFDSYSGFWVNSSYNTSRNTADCTVHPQRQRSALSLEISYIYGIWKREETKEDTQTLRTEQIHTVSVIALLNTATLFITPPPTGSGYSSVVKYI